MNQDNQLTRISIGVHESENFDPFIAFGFSARRIFHSRDLETAACNYIYFPGINCIIIIARMDFENILFLQQLSEN